jgi:TonB family protein
MLSPIPAFWRITSVGSLLLALQLAAPIALVAAKAPSIQQTEELDGAAAAKLLIHVAKPAYPAVAKVNFVQGVVKLEVKVTPKGRVAEAHVLDGQPILAVAALEAVRKWLYRPYDLHGQPVPFSTYVIVRFNLHPHSYRGQLPKDADDYLEKQIRPPKVINGPQPDQSDAGIQMKVLVGSKGEVVDATSPRADGPEVDLARKSLQSWKFRPARWGSLAVPWYITVKVPLRYSTMDQAANSPKH